MKRTLALLLAVMMVAALFVGCASDKPAETTAPDTSAATAPEAETTAPTAPDADSEFQLPTKVSEEPIDLDVVRLCWAGTFEHIDQMWKWQDLAERTNVNIHFEEYPITGYQEKLQLKLTTGDLPDAYYQMIFSDTQLYENGANGNLIPLNDLIEEHAPNIKAMFEKYPNVKKTMTMPDGNIYSLPFVEQSKMDASVRFYLNKGLAEEVGVPVPGTIEELTAYFKAIKEKHPDMYPLAMPKGNEGIVIDAFSGAWGLGNAGLKGMEAHIDLDAEGKVRCYKVTDEYKTMLKQFAEWYKAGYINPEMFTSLDVAKWQALGSENKVGCFTWVSPSYIGGEDVTKNFVGKSQLAGPNGDQIMSWIDADVRGMWSFMITKANEHPVETIKWVDYFYGPGFDVYSKLGVEGETFEIAEDGTCHFIGDAKAALDRNELWTVLGHYGGFEPSVNGLPHTPETQAMIDQAYGNQGTRAEFFRVEDMEDYKKYAPSDIWPAFVPTEDEADELSYLMTDINTFIQESAAQFITGVKDIDAEWDAYVEALYDMGLEDYVAIKQGQYDRYMGK